MLPIASTHALNDCFDVLLPQAAEKTNNEKYQFGYVDCGYNMPFCKMQKMCKIPTLKLYSNGFEVGKMEDIKHVDTKHMLRLMAMAPVLKLPKQTLYFQKMLNKSKSKSAAQGGLADTAEGATADADRSIARMPDIPLPRISDILAATMSEKSAPTVFETSVKKKRK